MISGVVINKAVPLSLSEALGWEGLGERGRERLYVGGEVGVDGLLILHTCAEAGGVVEVGEGLFAGAELPPSGGEVGGMKCVAGYCGWHSSQLREELSRNVWFMGEPTSPLAPFVLAGHAMRALGSEYEELASFPGDHSIVWEHTQAIWRQQVEATERRIELLEAS
ncbi:MAG: hypothetical protein SGPRY_008164 [Prymnesium sp.]